MKAAATFLNSGVKKVLPRYQGDEKQHNLNKFEIANAAPASRNNNSLERNISTESNGELQAMGVSKRPIIRLILLKVKSAALHNFKPMIRIKSSKFET